MTTFRRFLPKASKYKAKKTTVDNVAFDSKKEAKRYAELKLLQQTGEIFDLELQPVYDLVVLGVLVCRYRADFRYRTKFVVIVVEDAKSEITRKLAVYRIKKKLMFAVHGIEIKEV